MSAPALDVFIADHGLNTAALCAAMVAEADATITVRDPRVARDNLERIVGATLRIANRKGFAAMTLRELARASDLSLGALYGYIAGKDELAAMIQRRIARTLGRVLAAVDDARAPAPDRLARAVRAHLLTTDALRPWFFFLYMEAHHLEARERREAAAMERASEDVFTAIIDSGRAAGDYRDLDAAVAAGLLKAMLQDWYLKPNKHAERGLTVDAYAHTVLAAIEAYLTTDREPIP